MAGEIESLKQPAIVQELYILHQQDFQSCGQNSFAYFRIHSQNFLITGCQLNGWQNPGPGGFTDHHQVTGNSAADFPNHTGFANCQGVGNKFMVSYGIVLHINTRWYLNGVMVPGCVTGK